jgi:signal transduction histidine kinase
LRWMGAYARRPREVPMPAPGDARGHDPAAAARLRHDLKTPLTTILARSQLVARWTARSPTLGDEERACMLASLAAIDVAVAQLLAVIDTIGRNHPGGADDE